MEGFWFFTKLWGFKLFFTALKGFEQVAFCLGGFYFSDLDGFFLEGNGLEGLVSQIWRVSILKVLVFIFDFAAPSKI